MGKLNIHEIKELAIFQGLKDRQLQELLDHAKPQHVAKGQKLFAFGQPADCFYLLVDGAMRAVRSDENGGQITVHYFTGGELLGMAQALGLEHYPADAIAVVDCLLFQWPMSKWSQLVEVNPHILKNVQAQFGKLFLEAQDRALKFATARVEQRIADALLKLAEQAGVEGEEGVNIQIPVLRQDLSELAGSTLPTISRVMTLWEKTGLVSGKAKKITLLDMNKLQQIAAGNLPVSLSNGHFASSKTHS